jgi:N6-L-threonylcarbamoyladenine synthase
MYCLGIESTAHTFSASVVCEDGTIVSNVRKLFTTQEGGLIPAEVAEHHSDICDEIITQALHEAKITSKEINLVAFSQSPGLGHTLRIGLDIAKSIALLHNIPIIGVNHCIAHLEIGRLKARNAKRNIDNKNNTCQDPVLLYASGANTQIIAYEGKRYRVFGETLDNGIGNFIDGFARYVKLGFPGGPKIEELAKQSQNYIGELTYSVKGMDVSFSGMQTRLKQLYDSKKYPLEDLCYSLQETAFAMLIEVCERAMAHTGKNELLLGGGVACNKRLQEMAQHMCEERGATCFILPNEFNVDNAAMIAWTGILQYNSGQRTQVETVDVKPYLRTDEIEITWRE